MGGAIGEWSNSAPRAEPCHWATWVAPIFSEGNSLDSLEIRTGGAEGARAGQRGSEEPSSTEIGGVAPAPPPLGAWVPGICRQWVLGPGGGRGGARGCQRKCPPEALVVGFGVARHLACPGPAALAPPGPPWPPPALPGPLGPPLGPPWPVFAFRNESACLFFCFTVVRCKSAKAEAAPRPRQRWELRAPALNPKR